MKDVIDIKSKFSHHIRLFKTNVPVTPNTPKSICKELPQFVGAYLPRRVRYIVLRKNSFPIIFNGKVDIDIPEGLFITNVKTISSSYVSQNSVSYIEESTTVNSIIKRQGNSAGTVVYEITVFNNTKHEYAYRGLYYKIGRASCRERVFLPV